MMIGVAQVMGMNPTFRSFFSGAAAWARVVTGGESDDAAASAEATAAGPPGTGAGGAVVKTTVEGVAAALTEERLEQHFALAIERGADVPLPVRPEGEQ